MVTIRLWCQSATTFSALISQSRQTMVWCWLSVWPPTTRTTTWLMNLTMASSRHTTKHGDLKMHRELSSLKSQPHSAHPSNWVSTPMVLREKNADFSTQRIPARSMTCATTTKSSSVLTKSGSWSRATITRPLSETSSSSLKSVRIANVSKKGTLAPASPNKRSCGGCKGNSCWLTTTREGSELRTSNKVKLSRSPEPIGFQSTLSWEKKSCTNWPSQIYSYRMNACRSDPSARQRSEFLNSRRLASAHTSSTTLSICQSLSRWSSIWKSLTDKSTTFSIGLATLEVWERASFSWAQRY